MLNRHDLRELERILRDVALRELLPRFRRIETHLKADGSLLTEADLYQYPGLYLEGTGGRALRGLVQGIRVVDLLIATSLFLMVTDPVDLLAGKIAPRAGCWLTSQHSPDLPLLGVAARRA